MSSVLERTAIPAGKVFIKEGEENNRAYVIQNGEVSAFKQHADKKIEICRFGPGTIIGELNLMVDEPANLSYEAITAATVVTITRQDFQKRLLRVDKSVVTILEHTVEKIKYYENIELQKALNNTDIDETARFMLQNLLSGLSVDKRAKYEDALLPHINEVIRSVKELKKQDKESEEKS